MPVSEPQNPVCTCKSRPINPGGTSNTTLPVKASPGLIHSYVKYLSSATIIVEGEYSAPLLEINLKKLESVLMSSVPSLRTVTLTVKNTAPSASG